MTATGTTKLRILVAEGSERAFEFASLEIPASSGLRFATELGRFLASWNQKPEAPTTGIEEAK